MKRSSEQIADYLRLGEDQHREFKQIEFRGDKPVGPSRDDLAAEIVGFANAEGGDLLCGVDDDGKAQGMTSAQAVKLEELLNAICNDSIKPRIWPSISRHEVAGAPLLMVSIDKGQSLYEGPGGAYRRSGSTNRKMTAEECQRLAQKRGQVAHRSFDEQPVPESGFKTLEEKLWKPLLGVPGQGEPEPSVALEKIGLLTSDGDGVQRATVAGVLLCNSSPEELLPGACITATCYRGNDRASSQTDSQTITGPIDQQIAAAVAFVLRNMRVAAHKTPARAEFPQYSERAVFEAIVNAVVHRDYSIRGSRIRLSMFDDRLEIASPGALPNSMTVDSMATRQSTRNEVIASAMGRMSVREIRGAGGRQFFMERRGDGVPIIQRETEELSGMAPRIQLTDDAELTVVIPAASLEINARKVAIKTICDGKPTANINLLVLFPNKTWKKAKSNEHGEAMVDLYAANLPMTVFAAAPGFSAYLQKGWMPQEEHLSIEMHRLQSGGSVIFEEETGHIPNLSGRLNPILDTSGRTYMYASNIAIDEGRQQPVPFTYGKPVALTDADGRQMTVRILMIVGRSVLVEYCQQRKKSVE